jgi:O-antigen ligase
MAWTRLQEVYQGNLSGRQKINQAAIEMVYQKPVLGWQPVAFWQELGRRVGLFAGTRDAHNLLLHLLLEVGIVGTAPFLIGLGLCLRCAWKARFGPLGNLPLALFIAVLSANLSHTLLTRKPFWLVLALCLAAYENTKQWTSANRLAIPNRARRFDTVPVRNIFRDSLSTPDLRSQGGF